MHMQLLVAPLLVLYFDGSFTPPASSRSSSPSSSSFASCGAVILSSDDRDDVGSAGGNVPGLGWGSDGGCRVLAVGGRVIVPNCYDDEDDDDDWGLGVGGRSSAGTEYEGLLLGLRFVLDGLTDGTLSLSPTPTASAHSFRGSRQAYSADDDGRIEEVSSTTSSTPPRGTVAGSLGDERRGPGRLVIRGDCRTVVDQLNGSSTPRRLRGQHSMATKLLDRIQRHTSDLSVVDDDCEDDGDAGPGPPLRVDVELVPRDRNSLADAVAREAGAVARRDVIRRVRDRVDPSSSPDGGEVGGKGGRRCLSEALDLISGRGTGAVPLPIDVRIALLRLVAEAAGRVGDASALASAGAALREEAQILPNGGERRRGGASTSSRSDTPTRAAVEAEGIRLEIAAMRMMGKEGEAMRCERRHRHKLRRFPAKTAEDMLGWDGVEASGPLLDSQRSRDSNSDGSGGHDGDFTGLVRSWSSEASAKMERLVSREGVFLVF